MPQRRGLPAALPKDGFRSAFLRSLTVNALNPKALTSWLAVLFNPSFPYRLAHMLLASGLIVGESLFLVMTAGVIVSTGTRAEAADELIDAIHAYFK